MNTAKEIAKNTASKVKTVVTKDVPHVVKKAVIKARTWAGKKSISWSISGLEKEKAREVKLQRFTEDEVNAAFDLCIESRKEEYENYKNERDAILISHMEKYEARDVQCAPTALE